MNRNANRERPRYSTVSVSDVKIPTPELGLHSESIRVSAFRRGHKLNPKFIRPGVRELLQDGGAWEMSVSGLSGIPTTEEIQDIVGAMATDDASVELNYNDAAGTITPVRAALTGDVTASLGSNATTIANDAVTFAKMQDFLANTIALRNAGTTGDADDVKISGLTEETAPASGDFFLMEESGGNLRKVDWSKLPSAGSSDLVYVAPAADTDISEITPVQIVSRDVTSVGATDQLIVEAWFTILNDSAGTRTYIITLDFDGLFAVSFTTGALSIHASSEHTFKMEGMLSIRSTSNAYAMMTINGFTATAQASGSDTTMAADRLTNISWGNTASDASSTTTVTLHITSSNANATQTCRLHNFSIRKLTPT